MRPAGRRGDAEETGYTLRMSLLPHPRAFVAVALVSALTWLPACGQPPEKEMHEAQGALDAARAAGAPRYASNEYQAAVAALKRSQQAVADRDYRQALNFALDSRERAQDAVREAMNRKAIVRGDAERAVADATAALAEARDRVKQAQAARVPFRLLAAPVDSIDTADDALQKARAALDQQEDLTALDLASGLVGRLHGATAQIDALLKRRR